VPCALFIADGSKYPVTDQDCPRTVHRTAAKGDFPTAASQDSSMRGRPDSPSGEPAILVTAKESAGVVPY
jgi:hypothetical protein